MAEAWLGQQGPWSRQHGPTSFAGRGAEERMLNSELGVAYAACAQRAKRLIPFVR
ncbi:MAG: hypothetical protein ACM3ML_31340 [Micromonosporaceae bacterium]